MRKRVLLLSIIILSLVFAFTLSACGEGTEKEVKEVATGISLVNAPNSTVYTVGEDLDLTGLKIEVIYSNDETATIDTEKLSVSGYDAYTAGKQTVTVSYSADSQTFKAEFEVTVAKLKGLVEFRDGYNPDKAYDGKPVECSSSDYGANSDGKASVTWFQNGVITDAPVDVGVYEVKISIEETDMYSAATVSKEVKINKAASSVLFTEGGTYKVYDGKAAGAPRFTVKGSSSAVALSWYEGDVKLSFAPANAGLYRVEAFLDEDDNYYSAIAETTVTVTKAASLVTFQSTNSLSKVYDGTPVRLPIYTLSGSDTAIIEWYQGETLLESRPSNAGSYKLVISVEESKNYSASEAVKEFTISKAQASVTVSESYSRDKIYDGLAVDAPTSEDYSVVGDGVPTISYYQLRNGVYGEAFEAAPKDVGGYKILISVEETSNYSPASEEKEFVIQSKTLVRMNRRFIYDGTESFSFELTDELGKVEGDDIEVRVTFDSANVGASAVSVTIYDNSDNKVTENYAVSAAGNTFDISKATAEITIADNYDPSKVYDGTGIESPEEYTDFTVKGDGILIIQWFILSGGKYVYFSNMSPVNAGSYQVWIISGNGTNYKGAIGSKEFVISKKVISDISLNSVRNENGLYSFALSSKDGVVKGDEVVINLDASACNTAGVHQIVSGEVTFTGFTGAAAVNYSFGTGVTLSLTDE